MEIKIGSILKTTKRTHTLKGIVIPANSIVSVEKIDNNLITVKSINSTNIMMGAVEDFGFILPEDN